MTSTRATLLSMSRLGRSMRRWLWLPLAAGAVLPAQAEMLLVGNKSAASIWVLDLATGDVRGSYPTGQGPHEIVVSPDGRFAVVANYGSGAAGNTLTVIDWAQQQRLEPIDLGENTRPHGLRFLDATRVVATAEGSDRLLIVDVANGAIEAEIDVGPGKAHMVALSPDARRAYVTHVEGGHLSVVDLQAGEKIAQLDTGAGSEGVTVAADGAQVWVTAREADQVAVVNAETLEIVARLDSGRFPIRAVTTPDGAQVLVTAAKDAALVVYDVARLEEVQRVDLVEPGRAYAQTMLGRAALPIGAIASPDGGRVYVALSGGDEVAVIDTADWRVVERWETGREPDALAIAPDLPE